MVRVLVRIPTPRHPATTGADAVTTPATCPITELSPEMCAHCRGLKSPWEQAATMRKVLLNGSDPRWFEAQYAGTCQCGERFEPGAAIRPYARHADGRWVADCCAGEL
jgi:hypothetical protein